MKPWDPHLLPRTSVAHGYHIRRLNPPKLLILSFTLLIVLGTLLLKLPWANHGDVSWLDAAFTATSAVTVTGLAVADTGGQFTLLGQLIILTLIQLGGLGLMTFAVLMAVAIGFKLGLQQQLVVQQALNQPALATIRRAAQSIFIFTLALETAGAFFLSFIFVPEKGWATGIYHSIFYSISAFNNAGFALASDSLSAYTNHFGLNLTISALFIVGGLGYIVITECLQKRRWHHLSLYSRIILGTTLIINVAAFLLFLLFEFNNPNTLGGLQEWSDKLLAAWFQSTTPRTAGFNTLNVGAFSVATCVLFLLLMFIGGAPNSTASGIKVSTFVVMLAATRSFLSGNMNVGLGRNSIAQDVVVRSMAITTIGMMVIFLAILLLSLMEQADFLDIAFEVVSAFGTVGLSRGITSELNPISQLVIMLVMLIGRVGPLTLGYMLTMPHKQHIRYARTELPVG